MKNELEIKHVPFLGTELMAARDADGQIWAGVSYICNGIGLNKNEKDRQVKNVQSDRVLSKGCVKFDAGVFDPNNATVALKLDFVPLWLAKISITPTMEAETPELAANLEQYQLRAKDVLAEAFLPAEANHNLAALSPELQMFKAIFDSVARTELQQKEQARAIEVVSQRLDGIREVVALNPIQWREESQAMIANLARQMGGIEHIRDLHAEIYDLVDARAGCNLKRRLENMQKRVALEGTSRSKIKALNKLDAIAQEKRLIEVYIAIVKELAVKYGVTARKAAR